MNFKERIKPTVQIKALGVLAPRVGITTNALTKMFIYTKECSDEIGWLGTVKQLSDKHYVIEDVFLFEQRVHGATTEITPEGLSKFAEELLQQPDGIEIWNSMKMWGHSHVNMGITPSGQDDKQMDEFKSVGHDWFIRLICNKSGEMKLDFFDYKVGVAFLDIPWEELISDEVSAIQEEIYRLQDLLTQYRANQQETILEPIKEEMKVKVRKMGTVTTQGSNYEYANEYGRRSASTGYVWQTWAMHPPTEEEKKTFGASIPMRYRDGSPSLGTASIGDSKKKLEPSDGNNDESTNDNEINNWQPQDYFESDEEVLETFSYRELFSLSLCKNFNQLEEELDEYGWYNTFTQNDLERIYKMAYKVGQRLETRGE